MENLYPCLATVILLLLYSSCDKKNKWVLFQMLYWAENGGPSNFIVYSTPFVQVGSS